MYQNPWTLFVNPYRNIMNAVEPSFSDTLCLPSFKVQFIQPCSHYLSDACPLYNIFHSRVFISISPQRNIKCRLHVKNSEIWPIGFVSSKRVELLSAFISYQNMCQLSECLNFSFFHSTFILLVIRCNITVDNTVFCLKVFNPFYDLHKMQTINNFCFGLDVFDVLKGQ